MITAPDLLAEGTHYFLVEVLADLTTAGKVGAVGNVKWAAGADQEKDPGDF